MSDSKQAPWSPFREHVTLGAKALFIAVGSGCTPLGPQAMEWERTHYNFAVQETQDTQLLLNLVRLKYRDTPAFVELGSITSQFTLESTGDAGAEFGMSSDIYGDYGYIRRRLPSSLWKFGLSAGLSAQPTITYVPVQGEKFAQQLLSPVKIETLMLLYRSGWPLKRILQLCVQRLNRVENAARASGPTPEAAPAYEEFARVLELMVELNQRGSLDLVYETMPATVPTTDRPARIVMHVAAEAFGLPQTRQLWKVLGLVPERVHYPLTYQLVEHAGEPGLDHLEVETRSLLGVLFFLSQAVEVPERDFQRGRVTVTRTQTGEVFDWTNVTGEMLRVQSAPLPPARTAVSVPYRGSWFYIDDSDLRSKTTFTLLTQLAALQSGEIARLTPVLTLPVGK